MYLTPDVTPVPFAIGTGHLQKKCLSPAPCLTEIKHVESVCFVSPCLSFPPVPSVPSVVENALVWSRLQRFWEPWRNLG